ncbi:MAG: xanthine dehydrogenase family protein subunit M [Gammaproteobacteria bacterium]|nr:xanthine dehydrogenase family protein subunit M [Gammaproteobacteria bacterium]
MTNDFEFTRPGDLQEALQALAQGGRVVPLAGGTNIMVNLKRVPLEADLVVDLTGLEELAPISETNGSVRLGAGVTFAELLEWRPGGAVQGLMHPMCVAFAGPLIRNLATVGGNVCDASAAADISPPLLALDAVAELDSAARGRRTLPLQEFFRGVRSTALRSDELLTAIEFPHPAEDERWFYYKLGKRKADAISIVSLAMTVKLEQNKVEQARIALGAVAPVAMRTPETESLLRGETLNEAVINAAAATAARESRPIDDFRATGAYRRQMVEALVRRGLEEISRQNG